MQLPSFLTGQLWKIATGGAVVVAILLSGLLVASSFENKDLMKQRNTLAAQINDPKTGFIAQLSQLRTNQAVLTQAIETQNVAYDKLSKESAARLAATRAALLVAQRETNTAERKLAGFLATKPQGVTLEARVRDIDERALKEFLP